MAEVLHCRPYVVLVNVEQRSKSLAINEVKVSHLDTCIFSDGLFVIDLRPGGSLRQNRRSTQNHP